MKIIKIADVNHPETPKKPHPPMKEEVKNKEIYNSFGSLLMRGGLLWERSTDMWVELKDESGERFYTSYNGYFNGNALYRLDIYLFPNKAEDGKYSKAIVQLYLQADSQKIVVWSFESDDIMDNSSFLNMLAKLQIKGLKTPEETKDDYTVQREQIRLTRSPSTEAILQVEPRPKNDPNSKFKYQVSVQLKDLATGKTEEKILANKTVNRDDLNFDQALSILVQKVNQFMAAGFVDDSSPHNIPSGVNTETWDFESGKWKKAPSYLKEPTPYMEDEEDEEDEVEGGELLQLGFGKSKKIVAQDFEGYFSGSVPEYASGMLGSASVDASQINSMFGKAGDAIELVNKFDSSLLSNVSFIFNFSKSGAYGVYLSELDRAIKTKALEKKLESEGYKVEPDQQGMLRAYPIKEEKDPEEIQQDIERLYEDLERQGGTAFGINMNAVLSAAKQDAMQSGADSPDMWEWMALLHLGGTIVHEAVHAKGNQEEGPSESYEDKFINWALPIINEEYKESLESQNRGDEYAPLSVGTGKRMARSKGWYRTAEMAYYVPRTFIGDGTGSDLSGRHALELPYEGGRAPWGMMMQQDQSIPIEKRLGRQFMSPLPEDINQEHDSYEEQLRKYTKGDQILDTKATTEELLSEGYEEDRGYKTTEELLDEMRVKPIIVPINKEASAKLIKQATLFGWMNNLEISDGSTIPGLGDRVMAWDDRDESFSEEEDWIKKQPRYNPTYDIKGFYYRYIEPRFRPQKWMDMVSNLPGVHPALRFATKIDSDAIEILKILSLIKSKLKKKDLNATRLLVTEDIVLFLEKIFRDTEFDIELFDTGGYEQGESVFSAWIIRPEVDFADVEKAEDFLAGYSNDGEAEAEKLLGLQKQKEKAIKLIMRELKDICKEYGIRDFYVVGGYPRDRAIGSSLSIIENLDFSCSYPDKAIKVGSILSERLGVQDVEIFNRTMTLSFCYKGIRLDFKGNFNPSEVKEALKDRGIPATPLNIDVYNRDFTINMMIYDILTGKIHDVTGRSKDDLEKEVIATFFDPDYTCRKNPLIILRALKFHIRYGFKIDPVLDMAMKKNAPLLFSGKYTKRRLQVAKDNLKKEGKKEASKLLKEYGLEKLEEM